MLIIPSIISPEQVQKLLNERQCSQAALLVDLIENAQRFARPVISDYRVGAAAVGTSGAIYLGANIEFNGCQLGQSVHAEQAVIINAANHFETGITKIAISSAPCGNCRQFLNELNTAKDLSIFVNDSTPYLLTEFLPHAFGPPELGVEAGLLGHGSQSLAALKTHTTPSEMGALKAASHSYTPYTHAFGGAALISESGAVFTGSYIENAAFNPSVSPYQAAYIAYAMSEQRFEKLIEVVIAQQVSTKVDHKKVAKLICELHEPKINFRSIYFSVSEE